MKEGSQKRVLCITIDVDHVHELNHDVAHEEGDGQE